MVDVRAGRFAGRFGMIQKIVLEDRGGDFMVWVELFNPDTGGMDLALFIDPKELKGRRYHEGELLHFMQMQADAAMKVAA